VPLAQVDGNRKSNNRRSKKELEMSKDNKTPVSVIAVQEKAPEISGQGIALIEPSIPLPGNRPIAVSTLNISDQVSMAGMRPIDSSHFEMIGTISAMGERPIGASNMKVWEMMAVSGNRPISTSTIKISEVAMIMGNRPIASNFIDDEAYLMGFLD
jgi:hypothetical protein